MECCGVLRTSCSRAWDAGFTLTNRETGLSNEMSDNGDFLLWVWILVERGVFGGSRDGVGWLQPCSTLGQW